VLTKACGKRAGLCVIEVCSSLFIFITWDRTKVFICPPATSQTLCPMLKMILIILTVTLYSEILYGQTDYANLVKADNVERKRVISTGDGSEEVIYLGEIKAENGETIYHVLTVFRLVQAAIVKHGQSEIIFLDKDLKFRKHYELGLPDELPFKLNDNSLCFNYADNTYKERKIFRTRIEKELPKLLCVSPDTCY
jgi:hypothetical protein